MRKPGQKQIRTPGYAARRAIAKRKEREIERAPALARIRELVEQGYVKVEIVQITGIKINSLAGLMKAWQIFAPLDRGRGTGRTALHRPERALMPAGRDAWSKALRGVRYEDHPKAKAGSSWARPTKPRLVMTADSSMAWAG